MPLSKGDMSTKASTTTSLAGDEDGEMLTDEDLAAFEKEIEMELQKQAESEAAPVSVPADPKPSSEVQVPPKSVQLVHPSLATPTPGPAGVPGTPGVAAVHPSLKTGTPEPAAVHPSLAPAETPAAASKSTPMVTGNLAEGVEGGGHGILPQDLYDAEVERLMTEKFQALKPELLQHLLDTAKIHPHYEGYVQGIKIQEGFADGDWEFGQDEAFLDLVGLHCYSHCLQRLAKGLALQGNEKEKQQTPAATPTIVPQPGTMFFQRDAAGQPIMPTGPSAVATTATAPAAPASVVIPAVTPVTPAVTPGVTPAVTPEVPPAVTPVVTPAVTPALQQ